MPPLDISLCSHQDEFFLLTDGVETVKVARRRNGPMVDERNWSLLYSGERRRAEKEDGRPLELERETHRGPSASEKRGGPGK